MKRILTSAAVVVFAGIALAGCGGDDDGDSKAADNGGNAATTLTLVATDIQFDKTELTATAGEPVKFVIKNESDSTEHNLTIEDLDVDKDAEAGESAEQTVTPDAGTYEYHCEYHPSAMKGTLTVS
jgi:plastocyanin